MTQNRYDRLREKIDRDFSRTVTLTPSLSAGEVATLANLDDHTDSFALTPRQEKFGPFNAVRVKNMGDVDVRVYVNADQSASATVQSGDTVDILELMPTRYVRYIRLENLSPDTELAEGDAEIFVGNAVDSVELDLLNMGGQLDIQG